MPQFRDLTGQTFGEWTVIERGSNSEPTKSAKNGFTRFVCKCSCGRTDLVRSSNLCNGSSKSCTSCGSTRHGHYSHPMYDRWTSMNARCLNASHRHFGLYGGRGIQVYWHWSKQSGNDAAKRYCDWIDENLGPPPTPDHQIDRINNNRGYFPDNIRWASPAENCNNRRNSK